MIVKKWKCVKIPITSRKRTLFCTNQLPLYSPFELIVQFVSCSVLSLSQGSSVSSLLEILCTLSYTALQVYSHISVTQLTTYQTIPAYKPAGHLAAGQPPTSVTSQPAGLHLIQTRAQQTKYLFMNHPMIEENSHCRGIISKPVYSLAMVTAPSNTLWFSDILRFHPKDKLIADAQRYQTHNKTWGHLVSSKSFDDGQSVLDMNTEWNLYLNSEESHGSVWGLLLRGAEHPATFTGGLLNFIKEMKLYIFVLKRYQ